MSNDTLTSAFTAGPSDRWIAGLFLLALGIGPVLTVFENRLLIWPGLILTAALAIASRGRGLKELWRTAPGRLLLAVPVVGLAMAPLAFRPGAAAEFVVTTILPIFLAGGAMVTALPHLAARHRRWLLTSGILGLGATAAILAIERTLSAQPGCPSIWSALGQPGCLGPADFNQTACILAIWTAPVAAMLWVRGKRAFALALAGLSALLVLTSTSDSAKVGLIAAILVAGMCRFVPPRRAIQALVVVFALGTVAIPVLLPPLLERSWQSPAVAVLPSSAVHRLVIWEMAATLVGERPWTGWGFDNAREIGDYFGDISYTLPAPPGEEGVFIARTQVIPNHPHNAALEWWLDLGAVGTVLLTLFIAFSLLRGAPPPGPAAGARRVVGAGMAAATVAAMAIAQSAYGSWQPWWLTSLFIAAVLARAALLEAEAPPA